MSIRRFSTNMNCHHVVLNSWNTSSANRLDTDDIGGEKARPPLNSPSFIIEVDTDKPRPENRLLG